MDATTVDVVIIGGGVQGLLVLHTLIDAGYSCALVTEGDVGGGQTLHSHGFLNTGFGMAGPELPASAVEIVQPFLRNHAVELSSNWTVLPPPGFPGLAGLPAAELPAGFAPGFRQAARQLPDMSFNKRRLVEVLLHGREDRIIRGWVADFRGRQPVEAVRVQPEGSGATVEFRSGAVVVAAGCGSKRLLEQLVGTTQQTEMIKHRVVEMLCVRAPTGALPATSVAALPLGLLVAAHEHGERVTWYVTPMEMSGPAFDDVPNDAAADVRPAMLARTHAALLALYPSLPTINGLQVGQYAGYREDIGDMPGRRWCGIVAGAGNVIAALPSGLIGPWPNATDVLRLMRGLTAPSGRQPSLPSAGKGVRVGTVVEDRPGFAWLTWQEWDQSVSKRARPVPEKL